MTKVCSCENDATLFIGACLRVGEGNYTNQQMCRLHQRSITSYPRIAVVGIECLFRWKRALGNVTEGGIVYCTCKIGKISSKSKTSRKYGAEQLHL